jgi:hypothetical protein
MKGHSQYGGTQLFSDLAAQAFQRRGYQTDVLERCYDEDIIAHVEASGRYDLVFTINIRGEFRDANGRTLGEVCGGPHVLWHTDYVFSQAERLRLTPKSTALLLVDPTQVQAVRSIYGPHRFDHVSFFPHAAVGSPAVDDDDVASFVERRPIGILWMGSFQSPVSAVLAPPSAG